jgi:glycosyltransferase involved in cell wall biosynthesis
LSNNKRILMFTMGNWSHSNGAIVRALQNRLPQWQIVVVDLLQEFKQNKRALFACLQDVPVLAWQALRDRRFDRNNLLYAPATSRFIQRLAHRLSRKLKPAFTVQTTTRFDASGGEVPHFTIIDITLASSRQSYRDLFHSSEHALDRLHNFQQKVYSDSCGVFAMGRYVRDSLIRDYGVPAQRAFAIGAGPNIRLGERSAIIDTHNILFVGTDWIRKGGPDLLAAFRQVRQKHEQAVLTIVGCSPEIDEPGVNVIGRVPPETLHRYFNEARIFALPTVHEAFGVVFVEALHFGLPIIGTTVGAVPEMVEDGVNGFVVQPGKAEAISTALDKLLGDDELARRMGEASYRKSAQFTWERAGDLLGEKMLHLASIDQPVLMRPVTRHIEQRLA